MNRIPSNTRARARTIDLAWVAIVLAALIAPRQSIAEDAPVGVSTTNQVATCYGWLTPSNAVRIGNYVTVTLTNITKEVADQLKQTNKLVLIFNGSTFPNLFRSIHWPTKDSADVQFELAFGSTNRAQWAEVLQRPKDITASLQLGDNSELVAGCFSLVAMDIVSKLLAAALLSLFSYVFLYLASRTEMIRDPVTPCCHSIPDLDALIPSPSTSVSASPGDTSLAPNPPSAATASANQQSIPAPSAIETGARQAQPVFRSEKRMTVEDRTIRQRGRISVLILAIPLVVIAVILSRADSGVTRLVDSTVGKLTIVYVMIVGVGILVHIQKFWRPTQRMAVLLPTYSLARTQMAVWFFLIVCSWVFLWLLTGTFNTLTTTVLALMGIGAGTALGAEVQDAGKTTVAENLIAQIKAIETKKQQNTAVPIELAQLQTLKAQLKEELANEPPTTVGFFDDVLTDTDGISFHRFQMFVWTVVMGIVFVVQVCQYLAMPDFDSTVLALMGISSGTYLGFMIKEPHSSVQTA